MIPALTTATRIDLHTWIQGMARAVISGGSSSVVASLTTMGIDPEHFNLASTPHGLKHMLTLFGITFGLSALIHLFMFLQTHPIPGANLIDGDAKQP